MGSGAKAPAAPAVGQTMRRFVFELSDPSEPEDERVMHGQIREARALNETDAKWVMAASYGHYGTVSFRLVGERVGGLGRMARFLPLVPDAEIPDVILRTERVIGVSEVA